MVEFVRQALEGLQFVHEQYIFAPGLPLDILVDCPPPWVKRCVPSWLVTDKFKRRLPFLRDPKFYFNFPRKCVSYKSQPCDRHDAKCDHVEHISHFESSLGVGMLGSVIREDFIDFASKVFANLAFIEPLVSRMADDRHEIWPSIDMVVKEFEKVVSQLPKSQLRARLIPRNKRSFFKNISLSLRRWMPARAINGDNASDRTIYVDFGVPESVSSSTLHGPSCSALKFAPLYM
ncbi:hypothetical protein K466DRAFT_664241 [Polyporus arcularius HHB13444]|uniref:Uncharacterized protein n=1 Tax=Polyporus arcularius HHB13444 TaxID=1314778 RepID=A0A5C3P840_9APHY|nr:hypothetical protein K466DRAFT_664241 [Polyporus arcularius HHB13444]